MDDKSPVEKLRQRIEAEISRLPQNTSAARKEIYEKFRAVVTGNPKFAHLIDALESTINQIEQVEMVHSPEQSPQATVTEPGTAQPAKKRSGLPLIIAGLAVIVLAGAGWWYFGMTRPNPDFDRGIAGYSTAPDDLKEITSTDAKYAGKREGDDYVLELTGEAPIYATNAIAVDPAKNYRLTAKIRVLKDDPQLQGATISVGVATFDDQGKLQTSAPGAHRYAAIINRVLKSSEGWIEAEGFITGEGNENHNQFRPGTKSVKPMALINYRSPGAVSQISYLRFEEVK